MTCHNRPRHRIISIRARLSDVNPSLTDAELNACGIWHSGDWIEFEFCFDCRKIQNRRPIKVNDTRQLTMGFDKEARRVDL